MNVSTLTNFFKNQLPQADGLTWQGVARNGVAWQGPIGPGNSISPGNSDTDRPKRFVAVHKAVQTVGEAMNLLY